jgi:uncharacterized protein YndB with AHSA1/START domain
MKRDLRFENIYPYPPERVWRALTDPAAIADWLMPNNFEPRLGHKFQFKTQPRPGFDGIVNCEVQEIDPPRQLAYSWRGGGIDTQVRFRLEPIAEGTRLTLEHTGFEGARALLVSYIMGSGWGSKILKEQLPAAIERYEDSGYRRSLAEKTCA